MRELKFRIWIKDEERYYDESDEESYMIVPNGNVTYASGAYEEDGVWFTDTTSATDDVIVEQYTGLKDKNGKEIYEGDVVKLTGKIAENKCTVYKVGWAGCLVAFDLFPVERNKSDIGYLNEVEAHRYEIIGNIHENPELLSGTNVTNKEK